MKMRPVPVHPEDDRRMTKTVPEAVTSFFFADSPDLFAVFDVHGLMVSFNTAWETKAGFSSEYLNNHPIFALIHQDSRKVFIEQLKSCHEDLHGKTVTLRLLCGDEQPAWFSCYICYDPSAALYSALFQNITEQVLATREIIQREERLKILVDNVNEYLYSVQYRDGAFVDTFHNKQCEKITGYTVEEFNRQPDLWYTMIHKEDRPLVIENLEAIKKTKRSFYIEHRIIHKSGAVRWISNSCVAVINEYEKKFQYIGFILDVTDKKTREHELFDQATHDALTGIYNRWAGLEALQRCLTKAHRDTSPCTVCYCDINNLKEVNDRLGHFRGDELIKTAVGIILRELRGSDIFFRMGGDEFVLIFPDTLINDSESIINRINASIETLNKTGNKPFVLYVCFGFSEYNPARGNTAATAEQLVDEADKNMYTCKVKSREVFRSAVVS